MTERDRRRIHTGLTAGLSYAEIARRIGRPTSTISREIARNGGPSKYEPRQAHMRTIQRARRGTPHPGRTDGTAGNVATAAPLIELAVQAGMPRTPARVHVDLLLSPDGRRTAAQLAQRLRVSPATISLAVNFLLQQGFTQRERAPRKHHDVYVIDDDAWYRSMVTGAQLTLASAQAALETAANLHHDDPVATRLTRAGHFLKQVTTDTTASADRWRDLLTSSTTTPDNNND